VHSARVSHGVVTYPRGGTFGPRRQRTLQLVFVHDGSARIRVDSDELVVGAGFGALLRPGAIEHYQFSPVTETTHSWIHFWSAADDAGLLERAAALEPVFHILPTVARLLQELLDRKAPPGPLLTLRAYEILYRVLEESVVVSEATTLDDALTFIEQHLVDDLDTERLARGALVSRAHLFRLFRAGLDVTPVEYLWERRVQLAIELLQETGLSVAAIAERTGFKTPKHLARRVRAATGMTPVQVRAKALGPFEQGTPS